MYCLVKILARDMNTVKILCSNIFENHKLFQELFGPSIQPQTFLPSIPNLVYQYCIFANFETKFLNCRNTEIVTTLKDMFDSSV